MVKDLSGKKVVMIIANVNFRDEEYLHSKEILEANGVEVITAAKTLGTAKGVLGASVVIDKGLDDISADDYDGIVFIGGTGAEIYWNDKKAHKLARDFVQAGKVLSAICMAPATLAYAGLLKDKKVCAFSSIHKILRNNGAIVTSNHVETDGNIITADGPDAARDFGRAIIEKL